MPYVPRVSKRSVHPGPRGLRCRLAVPNMARSSERWYWGEMFIPWNAKPIPLRRILFHRSEIAKHGSSSETI